MSLIFRTTHRWNGIHTSEFPRAVSGPHSENLISREKKTLTYKEQCPGKRQAYLNAYDLEVQVGGPTPVYVDESGFPTLQLRRSAYAPKGVCVQDKISGLHRYQWTTLIAARIGNSWTALCFLKVPLMLLPSMRGWSISYVLCLMKHTSVIMDNASFHKRAETARLIAKTGASLLFLPRMLQN